MPIKVSIPESEPSVSVPEGHRVKCRKCGAVDSLKLVGERRLKRCSICGSTVAMRSAPRKPKIVSFEVLYQLDGVNLGQSSHVTLCSAEIACRSFAERGPIGRVRIAQLVELLDGERTGNVRMLRYDNYRGRRQAIAWTSGCAVCKGRGLIAVRIPQRDQKPLIKFIACIPCGGLGGELSREVNYRRFR